jgi:hypothetical protein
LTEVAAWDEDAEVCEENGCIKGLFIAVAINANATNKLNTR